MLWWNAGIGVTSLALASLGSLTAAAMPAALVGFAGANALIAGATLEWLSRVRRAEDAKPSVLSPTDPA